MVSMPPTSAMTPRSTVENAGWTGGHYQLDMELPDGRDATVRPVLSALWGAVPVRGCFGESSSGAGEVPCTAEALRGAGRLLGAVRYPPNGAHAGTEIACGCRIVSAGFDAADPAVLRLYVPMAELRRAEPRIDGFPFDPRSGPASLEWRAPLDTWLAGAAAQVFAQAPFAAAAIGFEVERTPGEEAARARAGGERPHALLVPEDGGLRRFPATR